MKTMFNRRILFHLTVMVGLSISCAPRIIERLPRNDLGRYVMDLVEGEEQSMADWGIYAVNLTTGKMVIEHQADKLYLPASNTKLYTTAAAMRLLGPEYRYATPVLATGPIQDGVLLGDLVVLGKGDPTWSARFYEDDPCYVFRGWADSLKGKGAGAIKGDIIGVDAIFDDFYLGSGWSWDYEPYYYAAQVAGLSLNENTQDVTIEPGPVGQPPVIIPSPATAYVILENNLVTVDTLALLDSLGILDALGLRDILALRDSLVLPDTFDFPGFDWDFDRPRGTNRVIFTGLYPADDTVETGSSVEDPVAFTATVLKETLVREGIQVSGGVRSEYVWQDGGIAEAPGGEPLFVYQSPPLREIIYYLNKDSQNFMAEVLLRTMGSLVGEGGGSARKGLRLARPVWAEMGVDTNTTYLTDGSGLSRYNIITPRNTVNLLTAMREDTSWVRSLPIAGVDGTLEHTMEGSVAEGRVFAKTGTLRHVRALSGYVVNNRNEWIAFSIMVNDYLTTLREVNKELTRLCELMILL